LCPSDEDFAVAKVIAREIVDSRGNPTVEVDVYTKKGDMGRAAVPSGASTGVHEALELRDNDPSRFHGKGVLKAIKNIEEVIFPAIKGMDVRNQREIDMKMIELDGTDNKSKLGANAILGVSLAVARAAANSLNIPLYMYLSNKKSEKFILPTPFMNVLNGGKHAGNDLAIQEFMIVPIGGDNFKESLRISAEIYHELGKIVVKKYGKSARNVGDEGGFAPPMRFTNEPLEAILSAIEAAGYTPGIEVALAIDAAASVFYEKGVYYIDNKKYSLWDMMEFYIDLVSSYPIISIEDPFNENDFEGFAELTKKLGGRVQIVGDDLFVTNPSRIIRGIKMGAANCLLLKVNQIGSLTEAFDAALTAKNAGYGVMVSHRSGETEDPIIADIAVALECGQIKSGAPARSDRTSKYNQLIRIEEELGSNSVYAGEDFKKCI